MKINPSTFKDQKRLEVLFLEDSNLRSKNFLKCLKHLKNLKELYLKNHKIFDLKLKDFEKFDLKELEVLDIRSKGAQKVTKIFKSEMRILRNFQKLKIFNGSPIEEIQTKNTKKS